MYSLCGGFALFALSVTSAHAIETEIITESFDGDPDEIVYQTRDERSKKKGAEMAFAYPDEDQNGVTVFVFSAKTQLWSEGEFVENKTVEGAASSTIRDLSISTQRSHWFVYWISDHYDADSEYLASRYNLYVFARGGKMRAGNLSYVPADGVAAADDAYLQVLPENKMGANQFFILYSNNDVLNAVWKNGPGEASSEYSLQDVTTPDTYQATELGKNKIVVAGSAGGNINLVELASSGGTIQENWSMVLDDTSGRVLDVMYKKANGNIYILYQDYSDDDIKLRRVLPWSTPAAHDIETVFLLGGGDATPTPDDISTAFNNYGIGKQYLVMWRQEKANHTIDIVYNLRRKKGFMGEEEIEVGSHNVAMPQVRTFDNGKIQLIWAVKKRYYRKIYNPSKKAWGEREAIKRSHGSYKIMNPVKNGPVKGVNGDYYVDRFRNFEKTSPRKERIKLWTTKKDYKSTPYVQLPEGWRRIKHATEGDYHLMILRRGDRLKGSIMKQSELFD